jgi:outer membrane lipoprotein carrier protein
MRRFLIIAFFAGTLFGQQYTPSEVLDNVRSRYQKMNDASAAFTQTVKLRYKQNSQTVSGTVKIKKGNKYRIESEQQTIVTDGVTVWMYTPKTKQVIVDRFRSNHQPFSPDKFLTGLPNDFTAVSVTRNDSSYILRLQPTAKNAALSTVASITVWTSEKEWQVFRIEMIEKNGTSKAISLSHITFNTGINDEAFRFDVTADMHRVDMKTLQ